MKQILLLIASAVLLVGCKEPAETVAPEPEAKEVEAPRTIQAGDTVYLRAHYNRGTGVVAQKLESGVDVIFVSNNGGVYRVIVPENLLSLNW